MAPNNNTTTRTTTANIHTTSANTSATTHTPSVTVIAPTISRAEVVHSLTEKRVAAYARVSTELDEQQASYEAQVQYYTNYIQSHPDWRFVEVYADEGITGTSTKNREGFKRMMADALAGKIDLILTKSISRFARNTVDTLQAVRDLKAKGIEVIFEKENIQTMDPRCEMFLTIFGSLAQEESHSISENVRWGIQKGMEKGHVGMAYKHFLGYRMGPDGKPEIDEEEAEIIRLIYRLYLEDKSFSAIAAYLTVKHIPTPKGKEVWNSSTVRSILSNEKYKGDALRQKTFIEDFLTKKQVKNTGQRKQYYIENSHPAIIDDGTFKLVQEKMEVRSAMKRQIRGGSVLSNRIICGDCGFFFGHKVQNSSKAGGKYKKDVWYCSHKYEDKRVKKKTRDFCQTPVLQEEVIKKQYLLALEELLANKTEVLGACKERILSLTDNAAIEAEITEKDAELSNLMQELEDLRHNNTLLNQDYRKYFAAYNQKSERAKALGLKIDKLNANIQKRAAKAEELQRFVDAIEPLDSNFSFADDLFFKTMEKIVAYRTKELEFYFKDGSIVKRQL